MWSPFVLGVSRATIPLHSNHQQVQRHKPIQIALVLAGAAVASYAGATLALQSKPSAPTTGEAPVAAKDDAVAAAPSAEAKPFADAELDGLRGAVANLQREVDDLRAQLARRDAAANDAPRETGKVTTVDAVADLQRDAIVRVMEEERQREQHKRDEERKAREKEALDRMAERAAKDLGLSPADQTRYSDYLALASAKRDAMFAGMRGGQGNGTDMRTAWEDYRTWSENELKGTFGDNLGQQIGDWQREQMRGGGMGFDFGGRVDARFGGQTNGGPTPPNQGEAGRAPARGRGRE